jgi:hypothetical protein
VSTLVSVSGDPTDCAGRRGPRGDGSLKGTCGPIRTPEVSVLANDEVTADADDETVSFAADRHPDYGRPPGR